LVSLKAWTGDVEPYEALEESWVQISGVPPPPQMEQLENV
jgi:hypothetical protein